MPFQKGHKLSKGRKKGTQNKRTLMVNDIMQRVAVDPLEILMLFAKGDWKGLGYDSEVYVMENASGATKIGYVISPELRLSAAKEASQYLYPKKKEADIEEEDPIDATSIEEKKKILEEAKKEIAKLEDEISNNKEDIISKDI